MRAAAAIRDLEKAIAKLTVAIDVSQAQTDRLRAARAKTQRALTSLAMPDHNPDRADDP